MTESERGRHANESGKEADDAIRDCLVRWFYHFDEDVEIGQTPFHKPCLAPFTVKDAPAFPGGVAILRMSQHVRGTADWKVLWQVECAYRSRVPCILVFVGNGFSEEAIEYAQEHVDRTHLVAAVALSALRDWLRG